MMLQDKVVVVAGVGSGLGRSVALASAREGADVVLAARTAARLDDVAKEIAGLGRRGLAVPTDVADAGAAEHLTAAARDAFGRVDALGYNALAMPPISELCVVTLDALGPGLAAGPGDHRAVRRRQLRRVPPLGPWAAADELHALASQVTGLTDFGPDDYSDGLAELIAALERDADLTPRGRKVMRAMLRGALAARLLSEAGWRAHPEYAQVAVDRPVFVTGLPRTGTTAPHRLPTADPAHQGLELWLAEAPQPRPARQTWADNPVFQYIQAGCERHHVEHPEFMGVHYMAADQVEECWQLLRQSMRSVSYECLAHLPGYSAWLAGQDWTGAYRRHRRNLQLIGLPDRDRRWVLKNPSHLFALDALLRVYPDALVIQTHRDPRTAIASVCSLAAQATAGWSTTFRGKVIGRDQLETWATGLALFTEARAGP